MNRFAFTFGSLAFGFAAASLAAACVGDDYPSSANVDGGSPAGPTADASTATDAPIDLGPCHGLDRSFGTCGVFSTSAPVILVGADVANIHAIAVQSTGKIVVAGTQAFVATGQYPAFVMRILADGSGIDTSFATSGIYEFSTSQTSNSTLALQRDDSVIVADACPANEAGKFFSDACVYRLSADGVLDTSYGSGGVTQVSTANTDRDGVGTLTLDAQGRVLLAGFASPDVTPANDRAFLVRLTATGAIDATFNGGAPFIVPTREPQNPILPAVVALSTGRILYAPDGTLAAMTPGGAPDNGITPGGGSNLVPLPQGSEVKAITSDPDDFTYAVGDQFLYRSAGGGVSGVGGAVFRLTPATSFDPAFGDAGEAAFPSADGSETFFGVTLYGSSLYTTTGTFVSKIGTNGVLSEAWGAGGTIPLSPIDPMLGWSMSLIVASRAGVLVPGSKGTAVVLARLPL